MLPVSSALCREHAIIAYVPLLGSFAALMLPEEQSTTRTATFLLIVVMSDTGGYIAGVLFGKHPMAPQISPKKSWGGFGWIIGLRRSCRCLHGPFCSSGPVLGGHHSRCIPGGCGDLRDLVESIIKRDLGIKDMSSFLPGHGGVMDRLDSLLLAAPVAWLIMYLLVPGG